MKTANIEVALINHCGNDLSVVNAARVSFNKESEFAPLYPSEVEGDMIPQLYDKDKKLINYLAKHKHFSPFNHSFISVRVKAPIFVARQLVKHKFMPWNEVSRRYVDEEPEFYFPEHWRKKADNVKQGSSDEVIDTVWWSDTDNYYSTLEGVQEVAEYMCSRYNDLLKAGVCPEQARMVLPQNTMTEWIWSGTLGAFCDMLRLRLDPHTQKETREVAEKVHSLIKPLFPVSVEALLNV